MSLTEGNERRGGIIPRPISPKPNIRPTGLMEGLKLFGCPVEIDATMPENEIWIKSGNQTIKIKVNL